MNNYTDLDIYSEDTYRIGQKHVHEFASGVKISSGHDHRTTGISSEAIDVPGGHIHEILTNTDFEGNHYHRVQARTSLQIPVSNNKHVHFVKGTTAVYDNHTHNFEFATFI